MRRAALAIGVSNAEQLPFLAGAVNGARAFHQWADAHGYDARLVIDDEQPVTIDRLRDELSALLSADEAGLHRLLIYFAGHGLIREAEEGLWLLSDWRTELRAVGIEILRRRLLRFNVRQIGIFADACRSLPSGMDAADLTKDGVLGMGPGQLSADVALDKFVAAQDGAQTFMIPGANPDDDRCLFSGVLLQGLWGQKPDAFSQLLKTKVTSRSLGSYLQTEVQEVASSFGYTVEPSISPTFPEGDDIYFGDGPTVAAPPFSPWPSIEQTDDRASPSADSFENHLLFQTEDDIGGAVLGDSGDSGDIVDVDLSDDSWARASASEPSPGLKPSLSLEHTLRDQERPRTLRTGSGFAVEGASVVSVWTPGDAVATIDDRPDWWLVGSRGKQQLETPTPTLVEFETGEFAAFISLPQFIASLVVDTRGVAGLIYREIHAPPRIAAATEHALGKLERGGLRADAKTDLAVELRQGKHVDPVRGVISAYLYDSIGDIESIRRMAYYYTQHHEPIPYDIALLAQLEGIRVDRTLLRARVPAVNKREPRTKAEARFGWTHAKTQASEGIVAGIWPWLRQGWAYLDDPSDDGSTLVLPGLIELNSHLRAGRFTTLDKTGAHQLATLYSLKLRARTPG